MEVTTLPTQEPSARTAVEESWQRAAKTEEQHVVIPSVVSAQAGVPASVPRAFHASPQLTLRATLLGHPHSTDEEAGSETVVK